jgi:hypothetical protein
MDLYLRKAPENRRIANAADKALPDGVKLRIKTSEKDE